MVVSCSLVIIKGSLLPKCTRLKCCPPCGAGDNTVLLQQVAAMLLKRYKDSFAGGGMAATWTYLRQWALGALPPNPLTSHDTGPRHLRDPAFLKRALR